MARNCRLVVNGKSHLLLAGEYHYWRHNPAYWDRIFDTISEIGIKIVSTFVPWNFHELSKGRFDFQGRTMPERNLVGFIEQAQSKGFLVILRPSPNEAGEWVNAGLPERVLGLHRLDPVYVREVKAYYDAVLKVIVPRQVTRNGPVAMVQADNEPYPDVVNRHDQIVGKKGGGFFARWLEDVYGDVGTLNDAWTTDYRSFQDAQMFYEEPIADRANPALRRLLPDGCLEPRFADTQRFVMWYAAEIIRWTAEYFRGAGIDVPVSANTWDPTALDFVGLRDVADSAGIDMYPARHFRADGKFVAEDVFPGFLESIKLAKAQVGYAYSPEFSAGIPQFWLDGLGVVGGRHPTHVALTAMSLGLKGLTYYMLVNRHNWCLSPIDEFGYPSPLYDTYKQIINVWKKIDPPSINNLCDVSLFTDRAQRMTDDGNWKDTFNAMMKADIDFDLFDPDAARAPATKMLVYGGSERLSRKHQQALMQYVKGGGCVVFFSRFPRFDERGEPCNLFGIPMPQAVRPVVTPLNISCDDVVAQIPKGGHCGLRIHVGSYEGTVGTGDVPITAFQLAEYLAVPGGDGVFQTTPSGKKRRREMAVGFTRKIGTGRIAVVGMNPSAPLVNLFMRVTGASFYSRCAQDNILTTIHKAGRKGLVLFVKNMAESATRAVVVLDIKPLGMTARRGYTLENVRTGESVVVKGSDLGQLTVAIEGYDVNIYRIKENKSRLHGRIKNITHSGG